MPQPSNAILKCRPLGSTVAAGSLRSCASVTSKSAPTCAGQRCSSQGAVGQTGGPMSMACEQCDNMVHTGRPMHGGSGQVGHRRRTDAGLQYLRRDGPDCVGGPLPIDSQGERRLAVRWRRDGPRRGARIGGRRLTRRATGRARASRRAWRRGRAWDAVVHDNARARTGFLLSASVQVWGESNGTRLHLTES